MKHQYRYDITGVSIETESVRTLRRYQSRDLQELGCKTIGASDARSMAIAQGPTCQANGWNGSTLGHDLPWGTATQCRTIGEAQCFSRQAHLQIEESFLLTFGDHSWGRLSHA